MEPGWGGRSTAWRPVAAVHKLFPSRPVLVKPQVVDAAQSGRKLDGLGQLTGLMTRVSVCPAARVTETPLKVVVSFFQML